MPSIFRGLPLLSGSFLCIGQALDFSRSENKIEATKPSERSFLLLNYRWFFPGSLWGFRTELREPNTGNCSPIYYLLDFQTLLYSGSVYYVYDYSINILGFLLLFLGSFLLWRSATRTRMTKALQFTFGAIMLDLIVADLPFFPVSPYTKLNCTPTSCGINGFVIGPVEYVSIFEILSTFYVIIGLSAASIVFGLYLLTSRRRKFTLSYFLRFT